MKITEALNSLIKTQNEITMPNFDVLNAIFSLSQEEFEKLNSNEKDWYCQIISKSF